MGIKYKGPDAPGEAGPGVSGPLSERFRQGLTGFWASTRADLAIFGTAVISAGGRLIGRGFTWGIGIFGLVALLAYLTPVRVPVLRAAGESHAALDYRLEAQRLTLDSLQMKASNAPLSAAEQNRLQQTRRELTGTQQQLESWKRGQEN